jgi:hypothetical protein
MHSLDMPYTPNFNQIKKFYSENLTATEKCLFHCITHLQICGSGVGSTSGSCTVCHVDFHIPSTLLKLLYYSFQSSHWVQKADAGWWAYNPLVMLTADALLSRASGTSLV